MEYLNNLISTMSSRLGNVLPGIVGAIIALIVGFIIATIVKKIVKRILTKTQIDEKLGNSINSSVRIDDFIAKLLYYLIVLYTLLVVLNLLGITSVLAPIEAMLNSFLGYLPNIIAAGIIGYAGYLIANIVSEATGFISSKAEAFTYNKGIDLGGLSISKLLKQIVFIFIFIPILIVAFDTLGLKAISEPATAMLQSFMSAIPDIIAAVLLLGIFYVIGKYLISMLVDLLKNVGIDKYSTELGIGNVNSNFKISDIIGNVALYFVMMMGAIAAVDKLGLTAVSNILDKIFVLSGDVFFGFIILMVGLYISNIAVKSVGVNNKTWLKPIIRFTILGLFFAFALSTMGIAENVVNLAFGLTLGAIAVAFALSFGLGGREAAGRQMEHFFSKIRNQ